MRSLTSPMMMSSLTSAPASITFFAARPSGVPAFTAARSMSPVEICGMPYFWQMNAACVPLPAPGAPNRISLIDGPRCRCLSRVLPVSGPVQASRARIACSSCAKLTLRRAESAEQGPHAGQVLRRVHARSRARVADMHRDAFAVPEHAQLLQRFERLQRARRQRRKARQEADPVGVDADVAQRRRRAQRRDAVRVAVAPPRDGRARKVE